MSATVEEYLAFDQICREGLAFLSRVAQSLETEEQDTSSEVTTITTSEDTETAGDEPSPDSDRSDDSTDSVATSFMDEADYANVSDPFTTLFLELVRLGPHINSNQLEEILFLIPLYLPQENFLQLLSLVRCNCPRINQEMRRCLGCTRNICSTCSYNILDRCETLQEELSSDRKCWDRAQTLAAKRVRSVCDCEGCLANFQPREGFCDCSSFFMNPDSACSIGQFCHDCIKITILSLQTPNSVKKTYNFVRPDFEVEPVGIYWEYRCDCGNEPDNEEFYCRLCSRRCVPYALNRASRSSVGRQNEEKGDHGHVPDRIEQGHRNWEEEQEWNTADCTYFFFYKQGFPLVTVDKYWNSGVGDNRQVKQVIGCEEEGILKDEGVGKRLLIDFDGQEEEEVLTAPCGDNHMEDMAELDSYP